MNSPTQIVDQALTFRQQRQWRALAELVDENELAVFREQHTVEYPPPPVMTAEEYRQHAPDMPLEVAEYFVSRSRHEPPSLASRFARVTSRAELDELSDREVMVRFLEAHDSSAKIVETVADQHPDLAEWASEMVLPPEQHRVLGEVIERPYAYVLYISAIDVLPVPPRAHDIHTATLRESADGWQLVPAGDLFFGSGSFAYSIVGEESDSPFPALAVRQADWVTRKFEQELSPELFPSLLLRFGSTPQRCDFVSYPKRIRTTRLNNKWSIQEHLGHLLDLEELGERRLQDFIAGADTLSAADMANRKTEEAKHNEANAMELLASFQTARSRLVKGLESLSAEQIAHRAMHPRLKRRMNVVEWIYFMAEHDDHHLAKIRELLTELWKR